MATPMSIRLHWLALLLFALSLLPWLAQAEEGKPDPPLSTQPFQQSLLSGSNATVSCHMSADLAANHTVLDLAWFFPNGSLIEYSAERSNFSVVNGTLTAYYLTENDSGDYVCSLVPSRDYNATATLRVYTMPSYLDQITVVYAIDGALVLVFLALGTQSLLMASRGRLPSAGGKAGKKKQQHQLAKHHQSRSHSRGNSRSEAPQQQQPPQQQQQQSSSSHRREAKAETGDGFPSGNWDHDSGDNGGGLIKSHRHHSTVPKPLATDS